MVIFKEYLEKEDIYEVLKSYDFKTYLLMSTLRLSVLNNNKARIKEYVNHADLVIEHIVDQLVNEQKVKKLWPYFSYHLLKANEELNPNLTEYLNHAMSDFERKKAPLITKQQLIKIGYFFFSAELLLKMKDNQFDGNLEETEYNTKFLKFYDNFVNNNELIWTFDPWFRIQREMKRFNQEKKEIFTKTSMMCEKISSLGDVTTLLQFIRYGNERKNQIFTTIEQFRTEYLNKKSSIGTKSFDIYRLFNRYQADRLLSPYLIAMEMLNNFFWHE